MSLPLYTCREGDSKATAAAPVFTTKPSKPQQPARQAAAGPDNSSNEQKATSLYVKGSLEGCDQQQLRKVFQVSSERYTVEVTLIAVVLPSLLGTSKTSM